MQLLYFYVRLCRSEFNTSKIAILLHDLRYSEASAVCYLIMLLLLNKYDIGMQVRLAQREPEYASGRQSAIRIR